MRPQQSKRTKFSEDGSQFEESSYNVKFSGGQRNFNQNRGNFSNKRSYEGDEGDRPMKFGRREDSDQGFRGNRHRREDSGEGYQGNRYNKRKEFDENEEEHEEKAETAGEETKNKGSFPAKNAAKEYFKDAKFKQFRLIVRNLPFKTSKGDLQNICSNFGPFSEIVLPPSKKMPGKIAGFCFIQFKSRDAATKAMAHFNENKFLGRVVAADWALDKDTYETSAHEEKQNLKNKVKLEKEEDVKPEVKKEEEEESEEEEVDDEESADESEGSEDEDAEEEKEEEKVEPKKKQNKTDKAMEEQRVVFLRNLSFDTDQEKLKEEMGQFGSVSLALICKFKDSNHSKGTAFVHFDTAEEAAACVAAADSGELVIDDRLISALLAIPREKAAEMEKNKLTKVPSDKRNLRLLRFALIREGTSAANGMSAEDSAKRVRLAQATRKKLENLHMFVSPVRLVVQNLPNSMTDAKLKQICREAGGANSVVTECRIWKDMQRLNAKGEPKSKGFAFVAFSEHDQALACLKKLNNNPATFTNERRPIVEFSVEDLTALQTKERRAAAASGQKVNIKDVNEKVRKQVQDSIGQVHASGMKFLPKFLGKKLRHRNMSNAKKKKMGMQKKDKKAKPAGKSAKPAGEARKKAKDGKKTVTKYLALQ